MTVARELFKITHAHTNDYYHYENRTESIPVHNKNTKKDNKNTHKLKF